MAIASMQKIQLLALQKDRDQILEDLQTAGVLELIDLSEDKRKTEEGQKEGDSKHSDSEVIDPHQHDLHIANIEATLQILKPFVGKQKAHIILDAAQVKKTVSDTAWEGIIKKIRETEEKIGEARNQLNDLNGQKEELSPWQKLRSPLNQDRETNTTKSIMGTIPNLKPDEWKQKCEKYKKHAIFEIINADSKVLYVRVIFDKAEEENIREFLQELKFTDVQLPQKHNTVAKELEKIDNEREKQEKLIIQEEKDMKVVLMRINDF